MVTELGKDKELEVKFFVGDLEAMRERLSELGAKLVGQRTHEYNLRFDTPEGSLSEAESLLRLRRDIGVRLTYKGPSITLGGVLARKEIEFDVSDFDAVQAALDWEVMVTKQINNLMSIAADEKDYIAQEFLRWFVNEQLEEISKMSTILNIIKRAGDNMLMAETYITDTLVEIESVEGGQAA